MQYLKDAGVKTDGWMLSPNTEMPPYTGPIHLQTIRNMSAMADNHFSYINMPFSEYFAQYYKIIQLRDADALDTFDVFSYHNYGKYRSFKRNELLLMFGALQQVSKPSFFSEVHSLGQDMAKYPDGSGCVTQVDDAEDMLAHMHDCFFGGTQSFVWWAYKSNEKWCSPLAADPKDRCSDFKNDLKWWMVHSAPVGSEMLLTDDHDGRIMKFGTLMTGAWRTGSRISQWIVNNEPNITCGTVAETKAKGRFGDGTAPEAFAYTYVLTSGWLVSGDVTVYQYVGPYWGPYAVKTSKVTVGENKDRFTVPIYPYSFTVLDYNIVEGPATQESPEHYTSTIPASESAFAVKGSTTTATFGGSLAVDGTDSVAFLKFTGLTFPAPVIEARLRVFTETPTKELLVATTPTTWTAATLTGSNAPAFDPLQATTLYGIADSGPGVELTFDVTLAFNSNGVPGGDLSFALFTEGQKKSSTNEGIIVKPALFSQQFGASCVAAYLDLTFLGPAPSTPPPSPAPASCPATSFSTIVLADEGQSCTDACAAHSMQCTEARMAAANDLTTPDNMKTTVSGLGSECKTGVSKNGKTWPAVPYVNNDGFCYASIPGRTADSFKCGNSKSDLRRICPCEHSGAQSEKQATHADAKHATAKHATAQTLLPSSKP